MSEGRTGVAILGATGSIGRNTLDVLARHPDRYRVVGLAAHRSWQPLLAQCREHRPTVAVLQDPASARALAEALAAEGLPTRVETGDAALNALAADDAVDCVMAAIVGAPGLPSALAAARAGKRVLLANKESLVMAGHLFMEAVAEGDATLLPIDSEHNAIYQCLPGGYRAGATAAGVRRILLTASGGPFRKWTAETLARVTPAKACAHPNWSMGRKISVDSATLMNKGLEFIEACWLFALPPDRVEVVVHPQSVVHSLVEYVDGSLLAQLGAPDMRTPIAYGLAWPERMDAGVTPLDLVALGRLDFEAPDTARFPCLALAQAAFRQGGEASVYLNAANEVAVAAFLEERLDFPAIPRLVEQVLARAGDRVPESPAAVLAADARARNLATEWMSLPS